MLLRTIFPQTHITFGNKLILKSQLNSYEHVIFFTKFSKLQTFTTRLRSCTKFNCTDCNLNMLGRMAVQLGLHGCLQWIDVESEILIVGFVKNI